PDWVKGGTFGIWVFGDPGDQWVRTRPIWNEYAYHVTNVSAEGDVPTPESPNWTTPGLNNFRANSQGSRVANAPNLTVTLDALAQCGSSSAVLSALVTNAGSRGVPA